MPTARSPNYPAMTLPEAIEAVRPIFKKDSRNKMPRLAVAKHLGYSSLNGRALGRIGALRAYGLLEGSGNELRLSDDAVALINAPPASIDRKSALKRAFTSPALFKEVWEKYEGARPSEENLRYWLVQKGFTDRGADKCVQSYLASYDLVSPSNLDYSETGDKEPTRPQAPGFNTNMADVIAHQMRPRPSSAINTPPQPEMRKEVFTLDEGDVVLTFPENLSFDSYEDLEDHLQLFLRKAKRRAETEKKEKKGKPSGS